MGIDKFIDLYIHHNTQKWRIILTPKEFLFFPFVINLIPDAQFLATIDLYSVPIFCLLWNVI